jgi:hypothetical protein
MYRIVTCVAFVGIVVGACASDSLTVSEYSTQIATIVEELDAPLDAKAEAYFSGPETVEGLRDYLNARVSGYRIAIEAVDEIDPPDQTLTDILGTLLIAEQARAAVAEKIEDTTEIPSVWESPESESVNSAEQAAIVLCYAAQERFDESDQRATEFGDVPWMPAELKDTVRVALGCP